MIYVNVHLKLATQDQDLTLHLGDALIFTTDAELEAIALEISRYLDSKLEAAQ